METGYYIIESHSGDRHIIYVEGGLAYFCGESESEPINLLLEDDWKLLHEFPIIIDGHIEIEEPPYWGMTHGEA